MKFKHTRQQARKLCIEALRSGKYQQGQTRLCIVDGDTHKHCCLGVFCRVFNEHEPQCALDTEPVLETIGYWEQSLIRFKGRDGDTSTCLLPESVRDWLGLHDPSGSSRLGQSLTGMNDCGATFEEIASVMESTPSFYQEAS